MTKVLVTGGNGFIGQHVCYQLIVDGFTPVVFDRYDKDVRSNSTEFFLGDVTDEVAVTEAMAHVDAFIHLAGVLGTAETIRNPKPAVMTNVVGGLNVFEAAAQYKIPGVNIAVGNHWFNNTYSITKSTMERFAEMFNTEQGTQISIVRALNAYGPGQVSAAPYGPSKVKKIMPAFINAAIRDEPVEVYGSGLNTMDMIYVQDVAWILVEALKWTLEHGAAPTIFEAGTGVAPTVNEIADTVIILANSKSERVNIGMRPGEKEGEKVIGNPVTLLSLNINEYDLVSLENGIAETIQYYRNLMK